jgi:hypothetical protein
VRWYVGDQDRQHKVDLQPGTYKLAFAYTDLDYFTPESVFQWWDGATSETAATQIVVEKGKTVSVTTRSWPGDRLHSDDHGNTFDTARPVVLSFGATTNIPGIIERAKDADMFKFTAPASGEYTFASSGLGTGLRYLDGYLYDSAKKQLVKQVAPAKKPFSFTYQLTRGKTYYLKADGLMGTGAYTLKVTAPGKDDDNGDTFDDASIWPLSAGISNNRNGEIEEPKDADMFCFTAPSTGRYTFSISAKYASLIYLDGYLYNGNRTKLASQLVKKDALFNFTYDLTEGQTYYLKADGYYGIGGYTLNIQAP